MNSNHRGHFSRALFSFLLVLSMFTTAMPPQVAEAAITDASTLDMIASTVSILERIVSAVQEFFGEDSVAQTTSGGNQGNGGNHPYLLFTDADVATLRAKANDSTSFNYQYWQILKNKCASDIGSIGGAFSAAGPPSVNSITNSARDLRDLAICSVLHTDAATRDRYITAVRQELTDMSNWSSWGIQNVGGVIYFVGRGYINIAIAYDIAYDSFTTSSQMTARTNLEKLFYKEMVNTLYYNDEDWGTRSLNERLGNHNVHAYTSMLAIGLAIKHANIPSLSVSIQGIIDKGRAGVDNILLFNYDRDGAAFEDINYHPETVARYAYMAFEIYKNVLGNDPFQRKTWGGARPALQGYTDFHSQMLFPWLQTWPSFLDGSVCNQDSNGAVCIANPFLPYILATEHYSDRVAAWYIERIKSKGKSPNDEEAVFGSLWGNKLTPQTPSAAGRPAVFQSYNAPKNSANSDAYGAGYTIMRTGFEDEKDIQLVSRAIDSAAFHGHSNHGSFILNAFGTQFITDYFNAYGRDGGGYTDNLNYAFQQSGKGHNSVLACNSTLSVCEGSAYQHDNPAPNRRDIYFEQISTIPESTAFSTGEYDRVTMDLTRAYQLNSENANVTDAKRHIIFIREGGRKGYFVVIDDFSSSTGYRWQQRYHYAENAGGVRSKTFVTPSITDNNRYQLTKVGATSPKLFIQQIYPTSGTTASIESRPNQYDTSETLGRWIQTTTNNASTRFVRVSLMYPSENGTAPTVNPTISGGKITVAVDGRSVTYDQSAKTVSVNTGGTTPTTYACSDGIDNDSPADGLIDYPADPGCTSTTDNDEYNLPTTSAVTCSPSSQSRVTGQSASFTASGGNGTFSWTATGGSPASGTGASFSTTYSSTGTKTVTVSSNSTSASCSVSVTTAPTSGSEIVPGRIAISSDGNHHDYDDVLATAETVALLAKTGQSSKLVYYGYSDHHWISSTAREAQMEDSGLETARMWNNAGAANFTLSNFYSATARNSSGNPIPNQTALNKLISEINASTASNPLWLIAAGPMDIVGRAMNAANSTARQYVHLISHSNWNNVHSDSPDSSESVQHTGWTWAEMQSSFGSAKFHYISDQNAGLNDDFASYYWLRDSTDSKLRWIWCRSQGTKCSEFSSYTAGAGKGTFDDSDTGMAYWLITGGYKNTGDTNTHTSGCSTSVSGDQCATPTKLRALFTQPQCNNQIDDDGDGAVDTADSGCSGTSDNTESGTSSGGDTTNPSVSISSPAAGATVSGTITISANASDNVGVARVEFYRGTTLISSDTSSPYATSWNTTSVANGSYSLTARAYDAAGNMNTSAAVSVNVNNGTTPTPVTCSPSGQSRVTGQAASFTAGGGNGTYAWSATGGSPSTGSGSSFSTTYSSTGTKTVTVSSNSTSASCSVSVTTAPSTGAQCGNGIDDADTEDTLIDMNDPGCGIATDTDESNPTPITRFTNGTRVMVSTSVANIRPYAGDNTSPSPQQPQGALGTVTAGPKWGILNGNGFWYWQVNFDSGTDGWTGDNNLAPATIQPPTACADGLDNDGDALVDLADPGCTSATDTDEYNAPPQGTAAVTALTLVNADLNDPNNTGSADLIDISNNADIGLGYFPGVTNLSIRAKTSGTVSKVAFTLNGAAKSTESVAPYALEGDTNGNYNNWSYAFNTTYTVVATPYNSSGVAATPLTVTFTLKQGSVTYRCADGLDNDGDGLIDLNDPGCTSSTDDNETNQIVLPQCSDGLDNDDDGKVDFGSASTNDPGCSSSTDNDEYNAPPQTAAACANGTDDDGDGLVDLVDPGCSSSTDNDEYNAPTSGSTTFSVGQTVTPTFQVNVRETAGGTKLGVHNPGDAGIVIGGPVSAAGYWYWQIDFATAPDGWSAEDFLVAVNTPVSYACSDVLDNDGDGLVDLVDPGCSSSTDNDEYNAPPQTAAACANGTDDDGDGRVDMNDPGCGIATDTDESNPTPITRFTNGTRVMVSTSVANIRPYAGDNTSPSPQQPQGALGTVTAGPKWGILNGNGFWYWQVSFDSGTDGWAGDNNLAPASTSSTQSGGGNTAVYACSDGIDNDGDGAIDYTADYGCTSATDTSEVNPVSSADIKAKPSNSGAYTGGAITIESGSTASVQWSSTHASSCTVTSTPSANTWTGSSGTQTTTVLLGQTTYTLTCYQSDMVASTDSVIINTIIPVACADGVDNDSDGAIDYPADSGCTSATDDDELSPVLSDTTAPTISNVSASSPNGDTLIVSWTTDEPATSQVAYGSTAALGELTDEDPRYETAHSMTITGLERKKTYYIQVISVDSVGNDGSGTIISTQTIARLSKSPKVTNLTASAGSVVLRWNNPTDYEYWRGTVVLRDEEQFINTPSQSLAIYSGTGSEFRDTSAQEGVVYYYTVYTFDDQGQYSDPEFIAYQIHGSSAWNDAPSGGGSSASGSSASTSYGDGEQYFANNSNASAQGDGGASSTVTTGVCSVTTPGISVTRWLELGSRGEDVRTLQRYLNKIGHTVATAGPGAPGQETDFFGRLTDTAVKKFQCETLGVCSGSPYTTGHGGVGPRTRAALAVGKTTGQCTSTGGATSPAGTSTAELIQSLRARLEALQQQLQEMQSTQL